MAMPSVARGWFSRSRRHAHSHTTAVKKACACCGDTAIIRLFLTTSIPANQRASWTGACNTGEAPSRMSIAAGHVLRFLLRCRGTVVANACGAVADTAPTPLASGCGAAALRARCVPAGGLKSILNCYHPGSTVTCAFGATRSYSASAAAGRPSWCRPACEDATGHFPSWHTVGRQLHASSLEGSRGRWSRLCVHVGPSYPCISAPAWRRECDGRHDEDLQQQQHQRAGAVSCRSAWDTSGCSETAGVPGVGGGFPPDSLHVSPYFAKRSCAAAEILHWKRGSRRRTLLLGSRNMLSELRPLPQFLQWPICSSGDGVPRAVHLASAGGHTLASVHQKSRRLPVTPRSSLVPADVPAAGQRQWGRIQEMHTLTKQQCCLKSLVDGQQIAKLAAAVRASCPFHQRGHWPTPTTCQSMSGLCRDTKCGREDTVNEANKQRRVKSMRVLLFHKDGRLLKCDRVGKPDKVGKEKKWGDLSVLHPLPECFRHLTSRWIQSSTPPSWHGARETVSAAQMHKSLALESSAARRAANRPPFALATTAMKSTEQPPPHDRFVAETASAAPTVILSNAETEQMCTGATTETEATTDGATAAATENSTGEAGADTGLTEIAGTGATTLREIMKRCGLPPWSTPGARGGNVLQSGTFAPVETPVVGGVPAGFTWRRPAPLARQNVGCRTMVGRRQQHGACEFAGESKCPIGWMPSAHYSSCSAATADALGKGARSSRAPAQLSRKELKGLQGHPRRYQLMGGRPEFHHVDRNKNGHIIEPTDKFQVVMTTSKNNVHVQVLNKSRAYRTIFGSFAGNVGYRKRAQQEPQCAYRIGQNIARKCRRLGICQVDVKFRRIMRVEQLLQAFAAHGLGVTSITHEPRLPKCGQNSTKPRKRRRV